MAAGAAFAGTEPAAGRAHAMAPVAGRLAGGPVEGLGLPELFPEVPIAATSGATGAIVAAPKRAPVNSGPHAPLLSSSMISVMETRTSAMRAMTSLHPESASNTGTKLPGRQTK